ncbi:hypothetical protein N9U66_01050 [Synechococcus sp. AH-736-M20]|nr:hypothetical protein [Synechococcus sp. AH-736-M20]
MKARRHVWQLSPANSQSDQPVTCELKQLQRLHQHQLRSPHCIDLTHGDGQGGID